MIKHNWVVTKEYTEKCPCLHADCKAVLVYAQNHTCKTCGQEAYTSRSVGDDPQASALGRRLDDCETHIYKITSCITNSKELQDQVTKLLEDLKEPAGVNWDRGQL